MLSFIYLCAAEVFVSIFVHIKLKLLTQLPASYDENMFICEKWSCIKFNYNIIEFETLFFFILFICNLIILMTFFNGILFRLQNHSASGRCSGRRLFHSLEQRERERIVMLAVVISAVLSNVYRGG